jgi:hypothetical protein
MVSLDWDSSVKVGDFILVRIGDFPVDVVQCCCVDWDKYALISLIDGNRWAQPYTTQARDMLLSDLSGKDDCRFFRVKREEAYREVTNIVGQGEVSGYIRCSAIYRFNGCTLGVEAGTRKVHYIYTVDKQSHFGFDCSLFSEIGEPWKPYFKQIIADNNLKIELYDNGEDYYERIE